MDHTRGFKKGFFMGVFAGLFGALLLYRNRGKISAKFWKLRVKADVYRRLKDMKRLTKETYEEVIDDVLSRYRTFGHIAEYELDMFADELRDRYKEMKQRLEEGVSDLKEKTEE